METNYIYVLLLLTGLLLSSGVVANALYKEKISALAFNPVVLFSAYFSVIHFLTPLVKHLEGYYRYQSNYDSFTLISTGLMTVLLYLLAIFISNAAQVSFKIKKLNTYFQYRNVKNLKTIALIVFLLGAIAAYFDYKALVEEVGLEVFLADRHQASEERGSARVFANLMIIGFSMYITAFSSLGRPMKRNIATTLIMVLIALSYYTLISSRNSFLLLILLGLTCFAANQKFSGTKKRSNMKTFVLVGCIVTLIISGVYALTVLRYSQSDSGYAKNKLSNVVLYMLDGAFGNDEALLWMQENEYPMQGGKTYLAALTNVIPRSVWTEKPLGGGPELINMIFPGSYVIGGTANNSLTTGILTEVMMNFGIVGLPLAVIAWALAVNYLLRQALQSNTLVLRMLYLILTASLSSALIYSEFLGFIVRISVYLIPVLLVSFIFPRAGRRALETC